MRISRFWRSLASRVIVVRSSTTCTWIFPDFPENLVAKQTGPFDYLIMLIGDGVPVVERNIFLELAEHLSR